MEKNKIHVYLFNAFIIICLLGGAVYVFCQFMHFGNGVYTDNARVRQNVVPQNCRVQGFIREVRFTDFQQVKKGDTLVVIEDAEFRLRLAQAESNLFLLCDIPAVRTNIRKVPRHQRHPRPSRHTHRNHRQQRSWHRTPPAPHTQRHKKRTSHRPVHSSPSCSKIKCYVSCAT